MFKKEAYRFQQQHAGSAHSVKDWNNDCNNKSNVNDRNTVKYLETPRGQSQEEVFGNIKFNPGFYELQRRIYKDSKIKLKAGKYLPKINLGFKILKKMKNALSANQNKQAYIFGNSMKIILNEDDSRLSNVLLLDEVSYASDDKYEDKFYNHQIFPIKTFIIGNEEELVHDSPLEEYKSSLIPFFKSSESGILNFQNLDCSLQMPYEKINQSSSPNPFYDCEMLSSVRPIDLVYFNSFRIAIFALKDNHEPESIKLRKYIYFPSIDFSVQQIRQPFKLVSTPLTKMLAPQKNSRTISSATSTINGLSGGGLSNGNSSSGSSRKRVNIKFGFVTLDQNQRICPLMASDPIALRVPLIGVWLSGVQLRRETNESSENGYICDENYLIWSIMTEFVRSKNIAQRFSYDKQKKNFLLILFSQEENPQFFEVEILTKEDSKEKSALFKFLKTSENLNYEEERNLIFDFRDEFLLSSFTQDVFSNSKKKRKSQLPKSSSKSNKKLPYAVINTADDSLQEFKDDFDSLLTKVAPPKPQSKPKLEESCSTYKTASFINNSFSNNLPQELQGDFKINPLAEKLFIQQAEQLKFLQNQVMELQSALLSAHSLNPSMNNSKNSFRHSPSVQKEHRSFYRDQSNSKTLKRENNVSDFKGASTKPGLKNMSDSDESESVVFSDYNFTKSSFSPKFDRNNASNNEKSLVSKATNTTLSTFHEIKSSENDHNKENLQPNLRELRASNKNLLANKFLSETQESSDAGIEPSKRNIFKGIEMNSTKKTKDKLSDSSMEAIGFREEKSFMTSSKISTTPTALRSEKYAFRTEDFSPPPDEVKRGFFLGRNGLQESGFQSHVKKSTDSDYYSCSPGQRPFVVKYTDKERPEFYAGQRSSSKKYSEKTLRKYEEPKNLLPNKEESSYLLGKNASFEKTLKSEDLRKKFSGEKSRSPESHYVNNNNNNNAWIPFQKIEEPTFQNTTRQTDVNEVSIHKFYQAEKSNNQRYTNHTFEERALENQAQIRNTDEIKMNSNKKGKSSKTLNEQDNFRAPDFKDEHVEHRSIWESREESKRQGDNIGRMDFDGFKMKTSDPFTSPSPYDASSKPNCSELNDYSSDILKRNASQMIVNENEETMEFAKDFIEKHLSLSRSFLNSLSANDLNLKENMKIASEQLHKKLDSPVKSKDVIPENSLRSSMNFPKIKFDFKRKDCDSSDDDEQIRKLEAKYLKGFK